MAKDDDVKQTTAGDQARPGNDQASTPTRRENDQADSRKNDQATTTRRESDQAARRSYRDDESDPRNRPGYLHPRDAAAHMTAIYKQARDDERNRQGGALPDAARDVPLNEQQHVTLPPGGLVALAHDLYPDDVRDPDKMRRHIHDLLIMNRHVVRDDTSAPVGAVVRIK